MQKSRQRNANKSKTTTNATTLTHTLYSFHPIAPTFNMHSNGIQQILPLTLLVLIGVCANLAASSPATQEQLLPQEQRQQSAPTQSHLQQQQQQSTIRVQQCREGCFEKFATKEYFCRSNAECLTCWDECAKPPPPKINKSIRETWSLHTVSMLQQDSLVLVDVAWAPLSKPNQCLVTWEVSGGGLMGNLLTESFNVQLSLWPDTKYRVQVTCKNKLTGAMSRSLPLAIDTAEAIAYLDSHPELHKSHSQQPSTTTLLTPAKLPHNNFNDIANSIVADSAAISAEQDNAPILPYEDQSAESINQHTNFIFNWHTRNSAISAIEPLNKPDLNILAIAALSDVQKPLLFGVVAGTLLLTLILLLYVCLIRTQRTPSDKAALMEEDVHSVVVSMPPATAKASTSSYTMEREVCKNPAICSRNMLRV